MRVRSKTVVHGLSAAMVLATFMSLASPAPAATSAATTTTFTLTGGALNITAPASRDLGSVATGTATISAQLGAVTVADTRGALLGSWTASAAAGSFTTGGATTNETIAAANANYWSGSATSTTGVGSFTPGQTLAANQVSIGSAQTAFSAAAVVGNNTVAWNPTLVVTIPSAAVTGPYTGTVTHSVA